MTLEVLTFIQGPVQTNAYLIADPILKVAAVIDPSWDGPQILTAAQSRGWRIAHLWYTHAHFDHIGGAAAIADSLNPLPLVALHPADHDLWKIGGGGAKYGLTIDPGPEPTIDLFDGQTLFLGDTVLTVRHTPGHTPGHVIFHCPAQNLCFTGDLIFQGSVGRTDLPGGSHDTLLDSIDRAILTLPDETTLLSGHGTPTTIGEERLNNPFL
jgi:hydroxyacylglutathione hydrolase